MIPEMDGAQLALEAANVCGQFGKAIRRDAAIAERQIKRGLGIDQFLADCDCLALHD